MYKFKKSSISLLAFLLVGCGASFNTNTQTIKSHIFETSPVSAIYPHKIDDGIFTTSTPLSNDIMTCYITSGSKTSASLNVTAQFTSGNYTEWGDRNESIYLVIDDEDWSNDKANPSTSGKENPVFVGYVSQAVFTSKIFKSPNTNFVIPSEMTYGKSATSPAIFTINNERIQSGAFNFEGADLSAFTVTNIIIPDSVITVDYHAFVGVPDTVTISCVASSKPAGWDDEWCDAQNIVWGYNDETVLTEKALSLPTGSKTIVHTITDSYIIGFINRADHAEEEYYNADFMEGYYPLVVTYDVLGANNAVVRTDTQELPLNDVSSRNSPYDAVGKVGSKSVSVPIDIFLNPNETVDFESFKFYNIFLAKRDESTNNKYGPDVTTSYTIGAGKRFSHLVTLDDILSCRFDNVSTFAGYTLVSMKVDKKKPYYYETIMASTVEENKDKLNNGDYRIRYIFYPMTVSDYRIKYKVGDEIKTVTVNVDSPLPLIELSRDSGNRVSFIVKNSDIGKGFSADTLVSFEIINLTINMHLWNNVKNTTVGRTSKTLKFGIVDVLPEGQNKHILDLNITLLLIYLVYIVVYALAATGLFFFLKNKYKNDEFRRVKPKKYLKTALIGFFGFAIILLAVTGLIYRTSLFRNTLYAFNPSDVLVVLAGIVALIVIGYFIKFIVGIIKANRARREILRLKLNEDVKNDGTN